MDVFRMADQNQQPAKTPQANLPNCPKCHGSLSMGEWMGGLCLRCGNAIP